MRKLIYLIVVGLLCSLSIDSYAQLNRKSIKKNNRRIGNFRGKKQHFGKDKIYNSVGFAINALNYYGDIAPRPSKISTDLSFTRPALAISFTHRFGPRYQITGGFMYGTLSASDLETVSENDFFDNGIYRLQRNLSFRNRVKELSVVASLDLFENMATYISRVAFTPYIYAGIAVIHHNPQAQVPDRHVDGVTPFENAGEWVNLRELGTEGQHSELLVTDGNYGIKPYKLIQPAIPLGIGVRFKVNQVFDVSGEFGIRYLFTDYIDDVSQNYVDLGVFGNNELAKAMSYRSNEMFPALVFQDPTLRDFTFDGYTGRDNQLYYIIPGYGQEYTDKDGNHTVRGNSKDKDIYTVFTIRGTYIIGKTFHRAKFR
jgi:hypothetical protein